MNHYRIIQHLPPDREPSCSLVEVLYNADGSIAAVMEPVFAGISPDEIVHDLGAALTQAACTPLITHDQIVGYTDPEPIPF